MRGLQVVSFSGEPPTPRQMLLRSAGYMLSAGTFFLGFLWVMWDEDELTWHDRLSRTHLSAAQTFADRKSTRLNSSHGYISYAVFCLKKKKDTTPHLAHH